MRSARQQLIADPNFEIGSHGLRHLDMARLSGAALNDEIVLTEAAYLRARKSLLARQCAAPTDAATEPPERMTVMRFPYGSCNAASLAAVAEEGQLAIQWDVVTGDPDPHRSAKAIAETILSKAHPGAIIVAHANGRGWHTVEALAHCHPQAQRGRLWLRHRERAGGGGQACDRRQMLPQPAGQHAAPCPFASRREP